MSLLKVLNPNIWFNSSFSTTSSACISPSITNHPHKEKKFKRLHLGLRNFHNQFHLGIQLQTLLFDSISHVDAKLVYATNPSIKWTKNNLFKFSICKQHYEMLP